MSKNNSRRSLILQRREHVAELHLDGMTMRHIAQELGVALGTVHSDLRYVERQWAKSANESYSKSISKVISKLDLMEKEAYEAFEKSQGESVVVLNRGKSRSGTSEVTRQEIRKASPGDPRYLEVIAKCIDHRMRVLGLNARGQFTGTEHLPVITFETVSPDDHHDEADE
jgi:hypothetical protein